MFRGFRSARINTEGVILTAILGFTAILPTISLLIRRPRPASQIQIALGSVHP